jgi:hypothetical protein
VRSKAPWFEITDDLPARVIPVGLAPDEQAVGAAGDLELLALDAGERLEGCAGSRPACRAVAVRRIEECIATS